MKINGLHVRIILAAIFCFFAACDLFKPNTPPVITSDPVTEVTENEAYEYYVLATDPDEDDLSYALEVKPSWLSITGNKVHGTAPEVNMDKSYAVTVKVSDKKDFVTQSFQIIVRNLPNNPPVFTSTPLEQANERTYYEYVLTAEDEDGDILAYSLVTKPSWLYMTARKIYGRTPEVENDSAVTVKARVSDGKDSDYQEYILNIINVPAPAISQTVSLTGDLGIEYSATLKDLQSATRQVYHDDVLADSLTLEITGKRYSEVLESNKKGTWRFVLSAEGLSPDEKEVEIPNYDPAADVSGLEGKLDFEQGEILTFALPTSADKNPEDNPVKYSSIESLDDKISYRIKGDSLYVTNKKDAIGAYSIKLHFGSEENGEGEATLNGEITPSVINYFNPFQRPVKGTYCYGSGDANQDGFIDSLDTEAISNGTQNEEADVNGDGIVNHEDGQVLESYLAGDIPYMPGQYEKLQTKSERDDWVRKMMAIDPVSEMPFIYGNDTTRWVSGNYATQTCINFFGYDDEVPWTKYDLSNNRRFNLPFYWVMSSLYNSDGTPREGHGMNAILTGDNALEFSDWNFVEPQNDNINVQPGNWNMTIPGDIWIRASNYFPSDASSPDMLNGDLLILYKINNVGEISYINCPLCNPPTPHPDLVKERP
ncbi:MAG: dockerin type I domain-containing protein [Candidatus Neomarinimicrobiota bacterium]